MPKTPATPPAAPTPKAPQNTESAPGPEMNPAAPGQTPPADNLEAVLNEAARVAAEQGSAAVKAEATPEGITAANIPPADMLPEMPPTEVRAGTNANPKTLPLFPGKVAAYALVRAEDGLYRAVKYTIEGNIVREIRTKEPDLKAVLAAQITDAVALDMPLFNDESASGE